MKKTKPIVFDTLEENITFIANLEREYKALEKGIQYQKDLLTKTFCPHKKGDKLLINLQGHTITVKVDEVVYAKGKIGGFYVIWGKPTGKRLDIFKDIEVIYVSKQEEIIENLTRNQNENIVSVAY